MTPRISVIVPAFNAADTIRETLQSLIAQTHTDWQAIVVDDGSTDGTGDVVRAIMAGEPRIRLVRQENRGLSGARNTGIREAADGPLLFLDSDDWIHRDHLQKLGAKLAAEPSLDLAYCGWTYVLGGGEEFQRTRAKLSGDLFEAFAQYCVSIVHTFLVHRRVVVEAGLFDENLRSCEDWALWQRIARTGARFGVVPDVMAYYRARPGSMSTNGVRLLQDGTDVMMRAYREDPTLPRQHPVHPNGMPPTALPEARWYLLCFCAGAMLGGGRDPAVLFEQMQGVRCEGLDPESVGKALFVQAVTSSARPRADWPEVWKPFREPLRKFLQELERRSGSAGLAEPAFAHAERLIGARTSAADEEAAEGAPPQPIALSLRSAREVARTGLRIAGAMAPGLRNRLKPGKASVDTPERLDATHPSAQAETYFEDLFTTNPDPWDYTNAYEQAKYEQTLALIPPGVGDALELACAEGHFTVQLAPKVKSLLTTDVSTVALDRCKARCAAFDHIRYEQLDIAQDPIPGRHDLIVCSEVLYFVGARENLQAASGRIAEALVPGGLLIMTHSNVLRDDPAGTGFDWDHAFGAQFIGETFSRRRDLRFVKELRSPLYRIQVFQRTAEAVGWGDPKLPETTGMLPPISHDDLPPSVLGDIALEPEFHVPFIMLPRIAEGAAGHAPGMITPDELRSQFAALRRAGFRSVRPQDWADGIRYRNPIRTRSVMLGFESCTPDVFEHGLPLLQEFGFTATTFLYADEIGATETKDPASGERLPLLDWPRVRRLQAGGMLFGSHGLSRRPLSALAPKEALSGLTRSREILSAELGVPIVSLAYPRGVTNPLLSFLAGLAGYELAVSGSQGVPRPGGSLLSMPVATVQEALALVGRQAGGIPA